MKAAITHSLHSAARAIACGIGAALLLGACAQTGVPAAAQPTPTAAPPVATATAAPTPTPAPTPLVQTVRFSATGDDLIHEGLYEQAAQRAGGSGYDFSYAYANMKDFYAGFDVNWLNQETLVTDACAPSGYPCFCTPTAIFDALYQVGFRVFSLSNNHTYDQGALGISSTMAFWASAPQDVVTAGLYDLSNYDNLSYQTVNGIKFGYLSYTEFTNGIPTPAGSQYGVVLLNQTDVIRQQMAQARANCDVLVVSCHWGVEGSHDVTDNQRATAQMLSDLGADLIIGTHPHVTQDAEWLQSSDGRKTFVVYSLGNFISAQSTPDTMIGTILDITFTKTTEPGGTTALELDAPRLHPVITQYEDGYSNIRVYPYAQYTDALGAAHGNFALSRAYIETVLQGSINSEFLALD